MKDFLHGKSHEVANPELNLNHEMHSVNPEISEEQINDTEICKFICDHEISEKQTNDAANNKLISNHEMHAVIKEISENQSNDAANFELISDPEMQVDNKEILEESLEQCSYSDCTSSEIGRLDANVTDNSNKYNITQNTEDNEKNVYGVILQDIGTWPRYIPE